MSDCIFCKIANGEIPTNMVYEDEVVAAFLDTSQVTKGHTLLVPKTHLASIFDYDVKDAGAIFRRIPIIVNALQKAFPDMKGINLLNNNGETAYQTVMHSHLHFLPRYQKEEGFGIKFENNSSQYSDEDLKNMAKKISQAIEV